MNAKSGQVSAQAKKANELLNELFAYLHSIDQASPGDFTHSSGVDGMARGIASRIDALCSTEKFTNGHDLAQTNFTHPRVHSTVSNFHITWKALAGDQLMPTALAEALEHLDRTICEAKTKIAQVKMVPTGTNFSNENAFQNGGNNQQNGKNVSINNGGGKNQKGGKNGDDKNNNKNNTKNGKGGKGGNSVQKTGNPFHESSWNNMFSLINEANKRVRDTNQNKNGRGKGRGNRGGRRGR